MTTKAIGSKKGEYDRIRREAEGTNTGTAEEVSDGRKIKESTKRNAEIKNAKRRTDRISQKVKHQKMARKKRTLEPRRLIGRSLWQKRGVFWTASY